MTELISRAFTLIFGIVLAGSMCAFIYKRHAEDWTWLAQVYGRPWQRPIAKKWMRSMVVYAKGRPARSYPGIVTIGVHRDGIALKPVPWLAPFHPAVFIPFADIQGWRQKWYWDSPSVELKFRRAPDLQVIMPKSQIKWIASVEPGQMNISDNSSPRQTWPWVTQAMSFMSLGMLIMLGVAFVFLYRANV